MAGARAWVPPAWFSCSAERWDWEALGWLTCCRFCSGDLGSADQCFHPHSNWALDGNGKDQTESAGPPLLDAEGTLLGSCMDRVFLHLNCEVREARARETMEKNPCHGFSSHHISYRKLQHCLFSGLSLSPLRSHMAVLQCTFS